MRRMPLLSAESINYQNTTVFKELELAFRDIMYQSPNEYASNKAKNEQLISAILQNAFKANCSVSFGQYYPCMIIFDEYHNGVLLHNDQREYFAAELKFVQRFVGGNRGGIKAGVNINTAQLSGLFSELPFTIYLPDAHLQKNGMMENGFTLPSKFRATSEEMAASTLHEMGHFFNYCEYFNRTVSTNQALTQLSKELDDCFSVSQRTVVIGRCTADMKLVDVDVAALSTTDKKSIIELALVTEMVELSRSELGVSIYDKTSSEFLADQFASRHGAGRHLVTFDAKLTALFGSFGYAHMSTPVFMANQLLSIFLCLFPYTAVFMLPINLLIIFGFGGIGDDGDGTYDTPEARMRRIRLDSVNRLKNRYISEEEKKRLLDDLKSMDEMIAKLHDRREWREFIATTLIPTYRKYRKTKVLQQQLEQLANNPLFVRAAELATL